LLRTFETVELSALVNDPFAWRFVRPWSKLNFPDAERQIEVEFLELCIIDRM
jgi:hypothetical protein